MYISDIKTEFYEYLLGKNLVIIVHHDIDALCSCKILQTIIKYDQTQYTLIPVQGLKDLKTAYQDNCEEVKCFVLINCGATIDIVEELDPPEDCVFFILDSHRPTDVCNIYSNGQIRLLWTAEDDQNVPHFEDLFQDDEVAEGEEVPHVSDASDDDEESEDGRVSKRRRLGEEDLIKRRDRRLWEERRNKLMFEYSQYSYYSKASAIVLFELAHSLAKDSKEILWLCILALTEQMLLGKIESSQYTLLVGNLQLEVDRVNRKSCATGVASSLKITSELELRLALYRHWTLEKSLMYSLHTTCKLKLWSRRGERRLQELLAEMGLPLAQSKQKFCAMDLIYRQEFTNSITKYGDKYNLGELTYRSFTVQYNFRNKFSASDMIFILLGILEQGPRSRPADVCFSDALDCLSRASAPALLSTGLERAQILLESCFKLMKSALDQRKIFSAGPFLYFILHETFPDWYLFSHPHVLLILARYIQEGYCERYRSRNSASMPMLVSSPHNHEEETCVLVGLPPLCEDSPKNFFGKAFEQAVERSNAISSIDYFDTSYIQLRIADRTRFLDSLTALLS